MSNEDLIDADLTGAELWQADLCFANLSGASLDGVLREDYYGAENVLAKYIKEEED